MAAILLITITLGAFKVLLLGLLLGITIGILSAYFLDLFPGQSDNSPLPSLSPTPTPSQSLEEIKENLEQEEEPIEDPDSLLTPD